MTLSNKSAAIRFMCKTLAFVNVYRPSAAQASISQPFSRDTAHSMQTFFAVCSRPSDACAGTATKQLRLQYRYHFGLCRTQPGHRFEPARYSEDCGARYTSQAVHWGLAMRVVRRNGKLLIYFKAAFEKQSLFVHKMCLIFCIVEVIDGLLHRKTNITALHNLT